MSALIEKIQGHAIEEECGCWRWIGATQNCKTPMMNWQGKVSSVRRFVLAERGTNLNGYLAGVSCGNPLCVRPDHIVRTTRSRVSIKAAEGMDAASRMKRQMNIARAARERGKLNMEIASAIRADDRPQRAIARDHGVAQHTIQSIKAGLLWREYRSSPFAGLMP